ncbi:MAG: hypothetical protein WC145_08475 [Aliarcobacter sp.]|jgi:hypothetical protein
MAENDSGIKQYATYTTEDIGLATVLLCQQGFFIVQVIPQKPKTEGMSRPWCRIEIGGPDLELLCSVTEEYRENPTGVLVHSKLYEEKRRTVMSAVQTAQRIE